MEMYKILKDTPVSLNLRKLLFFQIVVYKISVLVYIN